MTGIHELLDAVSSDQPRATFSIDDLVRIGRRRRRSVAGGSATGIVLVVLAAVLLTAQSGGRSTGTPLKPTPSAPLREWIGYVDGPAGAAVAIPAAQVIGQGRGEQIDVDSVLTNSCDGPALLTVVGQTPTQVTLSLTLSGNVPAAGCGPRPSSLVDKAVAPTGAQFIEPTGIQGSLGHRRLVDAATGRTIPYSTEADLAKPVPVPFDWLVGEPGDDGLGWEQSWNVNPKGQLIDLRQSPAPSGLASPPGTNATVSGHPATVRGGAFGNEIDVTWYDAGWRFDLAVSELGAGCDVSGGPPLAVTCVPTAGAATMTLSSVLAIADRFQLPHHA